MELLRNKNNTPIAQLINRADGGTSLHSTSGSYLGRYDLRKNRTYDLNGSLVGNGNLLRTLIKPIS
jgi:hypothetical protein